MAALRGIVFVIVTLLTLADLGASLPSSACVTRHFCSQLCLPSSTSGGMTKCACKEGYSLSERDGATCLAQVGGAGLVVYSARTQLRAIDLAKGEPFVLLDGLGSAVALDFLYESDLSITIFFVDIAAEELSRGRLSGRLLVDVRPLVSGSLSSVEGLAVDWISRKVYWLSAACATLEVAAIDGPESMRSVVLSGGMASPRGLAVDPNADLLVWADWDEERPRLEACDRCVEDQKWS